MLSNCISMRTIHSDLELFTAAIKQVRVSVSMKVEGKLQLVDYGGTIQKYDQYAVKINDTYYVRKVHEFFVCDSIIR
ncbi:hypothetical protein D3C71_1081930 [compost metagenome]